MNKAYFRKLAKGSDMRRTLLSALLLTALTAVPAAAAPIIIDFESDTTGGKPNGFVSVDSALVAFHDTLGADLQLFDWAHQSNGNGLAVFGDDASQLRMEFSEYMGFLSMDFGNDDPGWAAAGDRAWLQLYDGATLIGTVSVVLNLDDIMNQTISYAGAAFNRAVFWYGNGVGTPIGLIEIIDNVAFEAVPEPTSLLLLGSGLAFAARRVRRARK